MKKTQANKLLAVSILALYFLLISLTNQSHACIGKTIIIGYADFTEQKILAEILYVIISERTGTTVELRSFKDTAACNSALQKGDISLSVEYVGTAYSEIIRIEKLSEKDNEILKVVKDNYRKKRNLVLLNIFGFDTIAPENDYLKEKGLPLTAAPVIGKDTLKMFPVLPRLLNKLSKKIDNSSIKALTKLVAKDKMNPREVAQNFLKIKKLI